jgi:hypothetical protein
MTGQRRADERFALHSPIEGAGIDGAGRQFDERVPLEDVSNAGCRSSLRHEVQPGAIVALKPLGQHGDDCADDYWRLFLVIWAKRKGERCTAGVRSLLECELVDTDSLATHTASKIPSR